MRKPSISCVIPAYNEAARIQKVLDVAVTYPKFTEVIVVNDGSTDSTEEVVREYKNVKIISFKQNRGKAAAVITAIKKSKGSIIVLLDADLEGLHFENLDRLIRPVEKEECIAVSLRANSPFYWKGIGIDPASGERAFRKNFSERFTSDFLESKYAFELKFNQLAIDNQIPIYSVKWPNVKYTTKSEKIGFWEGQLKDWQMYLNVLNQNGISQTAKQLLYHFPKKSLKGELLKQLKFDSTL